MVSGQVVIHTSISGIIPNFLRRWGSKLIIFKTLRHLQIRNACYIKSKLLNYLKISCDAIRYDQLQIIYLWGSLFKDEHEF